MASASLVRALASGNVTVRNITSAEVIIYYKNSSTKTLESRVIRPGEILTLTTEIPVDALRGSPNLASLIGTSLKIVN
jgi:hypothetical protein